MSDPNSRSALPPHILVQQQHADADPPMYDAAVYAAAASSESNMSLTHKKWSQSHIIVFFSKQNFFIEKKLEKRFSTYYTIFSEEKNIN